MSESPELRLTARWVAEALRPGGGEMVAGDAASVFEGVSIDTRTLTGGELFFGITGERFDGGAFAPVAIAKGARGVVVPRGRVDKSAAGPAVVIEVNDPVQALQALARAVRRASGAKVVAITGSAGKTTTKEVTAQFLEARYRVIRNRGNLNNHIGLPLSLMDLRRRPDIAVVELGMNHAGEISTLVGIAEPDVRVWTNVAEAHLGFFASLDAIADAKAEIFDGASRATLLVANADDDRIAARLSKFPGRVVTFGVDRAADVRAAAVAERGVEGIGARVTTPAGEFELTTSLIGRGNLANILAATAVAVSFDVPLSEIAGRAKALKPATHRGEIVRLPSGVTVIDDSYNANPTAMRRALEVLANASDAKRRVAILGEMLELGANSVDLHEETGRTAVRAGVDVLIGVGGVASAALVAAAVAAGLPSSRAHHVGSSEEAGVLAATFVRPGDVVLVKGSRGIGTERVVEQLRARGTERN